MGAPLLWLGQLTVTGRIIHGEEAVSYRQSAISFQLRALTKKNTKAVRNAADCPAIDSWRQAAQDAIANGTAVPTKPAPQQDCPPTFGNSDIFGGSHPDPTP